MTSHTVEPADLLDELLLPVGSAVRTLRQARGKVVSATEGSYQALFDPQLPGSLSVEERLQVALHVCELTPAQALAAHYLQRLDEVGAPPETSRLTAILDFTRVLVLNPVEGDRAALERLLAAGLTVVDVVTLGQLIAFLSYQVRLAAGLGALQALEAGR